MLLWSAIACSLLVLLPAAADPAGAGLGYRGLDTSGLFPARGLLETWPESGPELLWRYEVGIGYAGVTVANDHVYVAGGEMSYLYVFTLDGRLEHRIRVGGAGWKRFSGTRSTPLVVGDMAITTTPDAGIYAIDLAKCETRWKINAWKDFGSGKGGQGWGYPESPILHGDTVIFNTVSRDDETPPLVAIRVADSRKVWGMDPGKGKAYSAADVSAARFVHNGRPLIVSPTWCYLVCLDADTGNVLWEIPACGEKTLTPVYRDGLLLASIGRVLAGTVEDTAEDCPPDPAEAKSRKSETAEKTLTPRERMRRQKWGGDELVMFRLSKDGSSYRVLWTGRGTPGRFSQAVMLGGRVYYFGSVAGNAERSSDGRLHPKPVAPRRQGGTRGSGLLCLDAETGALIHHIPAGAPGHIVAADGMVYAIDLVKCAPSKIFRVRVSLVRPTPDGFELAGRFIPELTDAELGLRDIDWEASACPVIAEGRLFLRYGPVMAYELRADKTAEIRARKQAIAGLVERLQSDDRSDRSAAVKELLALGWQAGPAAQALAVALKDDDETIRKAAAETLGEIGPSVTALLVAAIADDRVRTEGHASAALVRVTRSENTAIALVEAAAGSSSLREDVKALLPEYGRAAVPGLRRIIVAGDRKLRWWVIEVLTDLGPDAVDALPELIHTARTDNQWFRSRAAEAIGRIGPAATDAVPELLSLLKRPYGETRRNAAVALARIGVADEKVTSALRAAAGAAEQKAAETEKENERSEEQAVVLAAKEALKKLGGGE